MNILDNITLLSALSLVIFAGFFLGILIWVIKLDRNYIREMSDLPVLADLNLDKAGDNINA